MGSYIITCSNFCILFCFRKIVRFLYHNFPRNSNKGQSACSFRLSSISQKLRQAFGGKNVTAEQLIEENLNETVIKDKLKEIKENARGRCHS